MQIKDLLSDSRFNTLEKDLQDEIIQFGVVKDFLANDIIIDIGDYMKSVPLLLSGSIKILRQDDDSHELFLYHLESGDTCAMSLNCCMHSKSSEIRAIAEEDTKLIMIPMSKVDEWVARFPTWRSFVFESFSIRLDEMLETIDSIAFLKMDSRLMKYLSDKVKVTGNTTIEQTHQEIAYEMNTSRVVISRLLKQLEKQGKIKLHRYKLEVIEF